MRKAKVASLAEYRRKRDFAATREPRGGRASSGRSYIVQKHAASRLHYDFRLELDGTLKSWAVPKGPSVAPGAKRLAVHVEDHPVEYGAFEGVIPKGEYGGGTVMLWDRGTWEPIGDARSSYREGKLKFRLHGERLQGVWNLVRMAGENGKNWLLIKDRDEGAGKREPTVREITSVASGRTMEAIGQDRRRVWSSKRSERQVGLAGARKGHATLAFTPQLATLAKEVPAGDGWIHEIKLDGYRILAFVAGKRVKLISRNGKDWTDVFPEIARAVAKLGLKEGVLDGEVVALRPDGLSDFQMLQNRMRAHDDASIVYYVFDLPFYAGQDLRDVPLIERKQVLAGVVPAGGGGAIRFADHVRGNGAKVFDQAKKLALEGIVSKRADAPYRSKRAPTWLKIKCAARQELVVVGWTDPQGARTEFGSLLLAYHDDAGRLVYAGKVGTGFGDALRRDLGRRLRRLAVKRSPLGVAVRGAHWVRPALVAEVTFTEWTSDGRLRHPAFVGLREDKAAQGVVREAAPRTAPSVRLTNPDRVYWPEAKITKADLAAYYESVADLVLPHVAGRHLAIVRCPDGRTKPCFFQKHASAGSAAHLRIADLDGLLGLVQIGALEIHPWGARAGNPEHPDRLVLDLDPGKGVAWKDVVATALALRERLEADGLRSFVRTSGGKGLHVVAPLSGATWEALRGYTRGIAEEFVRRSPDRFIATSTKAKRAGRIFIDWQRNGRGATAIASYSTRARPGAPVAAPLTWKELPRIRSGDAVRLKDVKRRLARSGDPWTGFFKVRQSLPAAARVRARAR
jgi:bifunctional non-homologous end joining protein LigD